MYVTDRQITDTAIIKPFLRYHNSIQFYTFSPSAIIADTLLTIEFTNSDTVRYKTSISRIWEKAIKTQLSDSVLSFTQIDSLSTIVSAAPEYNRCDTLFSICITIAPVVKYNLITGSGGIWGQRVYKSRFALINQNNSLYLNIVEYSTNSKYIYGPYRGECFNYSGNWSIKDNSFMNNLLPNDTVVIQEKRISLLPIQ